jgi:dihydrodipicolinate synthase/N-acetylneuraminate lyase
MKFNWEGVFPAVTTKFTEDDRLDLDMFELNIRAQIGAGVNGIVLGGTLGEASTLTDAEKRILVRKTVEITDHRIPVILNIAEQSTNGAIEQVKEAKKAGANGLMLLPPMRYKATDAETVNYFRTVAGSTDLPIMIYNNPVDYKIMVTLDMFESLAECENIQAVKESTRDVSNITRMRNRFGKRFSILTGVDPLALESLLMGADGWVAGLVCAFPKETVAIYKMVKAGRYREALEIYRWFMPLLELDISPQLVQNIKLAELMTGLGTETVRLPRMPLSGREREEVLAIINDALLYRPDLACLNGMSHINIKKS